MKLDDLGNHMPETPREIGKLLRDLADWSLVPSGNIRHTMYLDRNHMFSSDAEKICAYAVSSVVEIVRLAIYYQIAHTLKVI